MQISTDFKRISTVGPKWQSESNPGWHYELPPSRITHNHHEKISRNGKPYNKSAYGLRIEQDESRAPSDSLRINWISVYQALLLIWSKIATVNRKTMHKRHVLWPGRARAAHPPIPRTGLTGNSRTRKLTRQDWCYEQPGKLMAMHPPSAPNFNESICTRPQCASSNQRNKRKDAGRSKSAAIFCES